MALPDFPNLNALIDFSNKAALLGSKAQWRYPRDVPAVGGGLLGSALSEPKRLEAVFYDPTFDNDFAALEAHAVYRWFAHHPNTIRALEEFRTSHYFKAQAKRGLAEYEVMWFVKNAAIAFVGYRITERSPDHRLALSKSARKKATAPIERLLALFDRGLCLSDVQQNSQLEFLLKTLKDEIAAGGASYLPTNISRDIRARLFVKELGRTFDTAYGGLSTKIVAELLSVFEPDIEERQIRKWLDEPS